MVNRQKSDKVFAIVILLLCVALFFIPADFSKQYDGYERSSAAVLSVDNSDVHRRGVVNVGVQTVELVIENGPYKGQHVEATNSLLGKLEFDKLFKEGDRALVVIKGNDNKVEDISVVDYYRLDIEILLFSLFGLMLILYARWKGVKALLSFIFTMLMLWKVLWPLFIKGWNPIIITMLVVSAIAGCVIFLVVGLNRTGTVAFLGTVIGVFCTCGLALLFGDLFKIHGAVLPYAETLLHIGFSNIDLTGIFFAGIFLASSGAMMDVAVDIAVAVGEMVLQNPHLTRKKAIASGFNVGRAVTGTMTTTLLLAYSGSFTALMMVFMVQGTPIVNILNITYIAAEILHTLVGSFGVILVAPFTAVLAGWMLVHAAKD